MIIPSLGTRFLESTDEYLKQNWQSLTCANIFELYDELYKALKNYKGNSHGFTGYSEYLLFRFLYHQIGEIFGTLEIKPVEHSKTASRFSSVKDPNLWISQSIPIRVSNHRQSPDIAIGENKHLLRVASVKIYPVNGISTLQEEVRKLSELKKYHEALMASIIIFYDSLKETEEQALLEDKAWLQILVLRDNKKSMANELTRKLFLDRLPKVTN